MTEKVELPYYFIYHRHGEVLDSRLRGNDGREGNGSLFSSPRCTSFENLLNETLLAMTEGKQNK
jgi:hypothetical protein